MNHSPFGRRTFLGACGCSVGLSLRAEAANPSSLQSYRTFGCWIPPSYSQAFFDQATSLPNDLATMPIDVRSLAPHSANPNFDLALAQTLLMLCDRFKVIPNFSYYKEAVGEENAIATEQNIGPHTDGTVLLGLALLGDTLTKGGSAGTLGIAMIVAHEWGHIVANKQGFNNSLAPDKTQPFRAEQFADYMAGVFAGTRRQDDENFPAQYFAMTATDQADSQIRGTHGTKQERGRAVSAGFGAINVRNMTVAQAIQAGYGYAMSVK